MKKNMGNRLKVGEKVLMVEVVLDENGKIDFYKTLVENSYEEVLVIKYNDESSDEVTVINDKGKEYSGTYLFNHIKEKRCLLRREEFVNGLKNLTYRLYGYGNPFNEEDIRNIHKRINCTCNHLFVKLKEGFTSPGYHSSDYEYVDPRIYCLHCGLTNRWEILRDEYKTLLDKLEEEAYLDYVKTFKPKNVRFDKGDASWIPFISQEAHNFINPKEYYLKAKELKPNASNEEIFKIMTQIDNKNYDETQKKYNKKI